MKTRGILSRLFDRRTPVKKRGENDTTSFRRARQEQEAHGLSEARKEAELEAHIDRLYQAHVRPAQERIETMLRREGIQFRSEARRGASRLVLSIRPCGIDRCFDYEVTIDSALIAVVASAPYDTHYFPLIRFGPDAANEIVTYFTNLLASRLRQ